jgi:hypothetical protein
MISRVLRLIYCKKAVSVKRPGWDRGNEPVVDAVTADGGTAGARAFADGSGFVVEGENVSNKDGAIFSRRFSS